MIYEEKAVGVFIGGRGNLDLTETKYEANYFRRIFHTMR